MNLVSLLLVGVNWGPLGAGALAFLAGALAFALGIVAKAIPDAVADRRRLDHDLRMRQLGIWHDQQMRQLGVWHDRQMRLLDVGLRHGIDFLTAADWLARCNQSVDTANFALDGARGQDDATWQHYRGLLMEARESAGTAFREAQIAYTAVSLLMPAVADTARRYLDLCAAAKAHPDSDRDERERAREATEAALRSAVGAPAMTQRQQPADAAGDERAAPPA